MSMRAVACAVALALPIQALADPLVLKRTGKWIVEYDNDACHLYAQFGEGATLARFSRYWLSDTFDFRLFGAPAKSESFEDIRFDFGLGTKFTRRGMAATAGKVPVLIVNGVRLDGFTPVKPGDPAPAVTPADEARVTGMTIGRVRQQDVRLEFGSLGRPFEQLRNCLSSLVTRWGYDPQVQMTLSRKLTPAGNPQNWVTDTDYPADALRKRQMGIVAFRLDVDAKGVVTGCTILEHTDAVEVLSKKVCEMLGKRASFNPALDAKGTPVRSFFVSKFNWVIPGY